MFVHHFIPFLIILSHSDSDVNQPELARQTELESNWKVESFKRKTKQFLKAKSESEKKIGKLKAKSKSFIYITFFYRFCPPFHNHIAGTNQKFHLVFYSIGTSEISGKKWKVESFKWKAKKIFGIEKRKAKAEKIIEKLKAKSLILKTASEKQKQKFYDFTFQLWWQTWRRTV